MRAQGDDIGIGLRVDRPKGARNLGNVNKIINLYRSRHRSLRQISHRLKSVGGGYLPKLLCHNSPSYSTIKGYRSRSGIIGCNSNRIVCCNCSGH